MAELNDFKRRTCNARSMWPQAKALFRGGVRHQDGDSKRLDGKEFRRAELVRHLADSAPWEGSDLPTVI
jgi:hypothetical protein